MTISQRWMIRITLCLSVICVAGVIAQDFLDDESLFAAEESTMDDAVTGSLPEGDAASDDDLFGALFGEEDGLEGLAAGEEDATAVIDDAALEDDLGDLTGAADALENDEAFGTVDAEASTSDAFADLAPADAEDEADLPETTDGEDWNADTSLDDMFSGGDQDTGDAVEETMEEAGLGDMFEGELDDGGLASEPDNAASDDFDSLFGEMATEEPADTATTDVPDKGTEEAGGDDLDSLFGDLAADEPATAAEEAAPEPADAGGDDLDSLFGDLAGDEPAAVAEEAAPEPADAGGDDLDSLFGDLAGDEPAAAAEEAAPEPSDAGGDDLDALFSEMAADDPIEPEPTAAVEPTDDADEDLDSVFGEMAEPAPVVEAATAPSDDSQEKPVYQDDLALDDDIFSDLAAEASEDTAPPVAVPVQQTPPPRTANMGSATAPADEATDAALPTTRRETRASRRAADAPRGTAAFEESERLLRIARRDHALTNLENARKALEIGDYRMAIQRFEESMRILPERSDFEPIRAQVRLEIAEAYYQQARRLVEMKDLEAALASAESAARNGHRKAPRLVARIKEYIEEPEQLEEPPEVIRRWEEDDFKRIDREIEEWLRRGREAYLTGEYEKAILAFESVLARDPENKEAIRMMRAAASRQYDRSNMELETTRQRMVAAVRDTWNPRQYGLHEEPIETDEGMITGVRDDEKQRQNILAKMNEIRIPEVNFRQANIRDVLTFLQQQSVEFDPAENRAERTGVNIILQLDPGRNKGTEGAGRAAQPQPDPFGLPPAGGGDAGGGSADDVLVTFSALDISLKEALDIVVDVADLKYRIRGNVVMVVPSGSADGEIIHRMYDVLPSAIARLQDLSSAVTAGGGQQGGGGGGDFLSLQGQGDLGGGQDVDLRKFFEEMGVAWPTRSSIKFVRGLGKLVVANTQENLAVFEKVLSILNVVPYQIEIEARFVEVAQTDVDSLGLEWMLTDNWEIAEMAEDANLPLNARRRIVMDANANNGGFTSGNRFLTDAGDGTMGLLGENMMDNIATVSSVLTNPELSLVLHALQQKGNTDLLSAPKITTQSGQQATIKVVTEYIYPTAFETSGISGGETTTTTGTAGGGTVGAVVTPLDFQTREVGVILEVLPEVSPEGQMINLLLSPEVVSEPTWRNYGSTYTSFDPNGNPIEQQLNMEQPFFHTRQLRTNLLIYNGATVVMGGMITEIRNSVDDKVPFLGDIPVFGRLFRSKYDASEKRNLLIFVTARLVDPAGRPLNRERMGLDNSIAEKIVGSEN